MRKVIGPILFWFLLFAFDQVEAQENGFPFGQPQLSDMDMITYPKDTSAVAVVLQEFGEAYLEGYQKVRFIYHVRMKILRQPGVKYGNVKLYLHRQNDNEDIVTSFRASSYNYENGRMVETKMDDASRFREEPGPYTIVQNYPIPNVKVGSIIEYSYSKTTPWLHNFHAWEFQDDIPKVVSEYWAVIPASFQYNITLRGLLKLTSNEAEIVKGEYTMSGTTRQDQSRMKYMMRDVPAFVTEPYMSARSNYISRLNFELEKVQLPDGRIDKMTTEWKDAALELKRELSFGGQIRKGANFLNDEVAPVVAGVSDPLEKARKVYDFMRGHFKWNGINGVYSENGVKNAFDAGKGNIGDINLALIAALRAADLPADPVILSTRANGLPVEIHPVLTDFNYVIARVDIGGKVYLLDATDDYMPFGFLPEKCLNGKGRWLDDKDSQWVTLTPPTGRKSVTMITMKVLPDGTLTGNLASTYLGYSGIEQRQALLGSANEKEYINHKTSKYNMTSISDVVVENAQDVEKPLVVKLNFKGEVFSAPTATPWLFNPFFAGTWKENPLKAKERLYPVEFGTPIDERMIITIDLPEGSVVQSLPENAGIVLPNGGGRYLFQAKADGNKVSMTSNFVIAHEQYGAGEYQTLKEFIARMIQTQATDIVVSGK